MSGADFYVICFAAGFTFSFLSFVLGAAHWHVRLPHFLHGHASMPHGGAARGFTGSGKIHAPAKGAAKTHTPAQHMPPFNVFTLSAFLAWFGGIGYLLTSYSTLWITAVFAAALISGVAGAGIIFLFFNKVLMSADENPDPADYQFVGLLGRISVPIREGGTGEIIYTQGGTRRTCGARAEKGTAIAKGSEVVVTRYEKGIAYVTLWEEFAGD
jgi:membrane protein implicated in regulation of membrane protease activity